MASMFYGANNVKVFGGDFKTINGSYHRHEHNTYQNNHNSNNILGNTYTDMNNDHSQTFYGGKHYHPSHHQRPARTQTAEELTRPHDPPTSSPPTAQHPAVPPGRSQTLPPTAVNPSLSQFTPGIPSLSSNPYSSAPFSQSISNGNNLHREFMDTKPGDVFGMDADTMFHFQMLMGCVERQNSDDGDDDDNDITAIHGAEPGVLHEHARSQSPPTARMAQLSLGDLSLYSDSRLHPQAQYSPQTAGSVFEIPPPIPQSRPQAQSHYAQTAASILAQATPSSFPSHYQHQHQGQQYQPHQPVPTPNLSNVPPFLGGSFQAVADAAQMQASAHGQSFVNAPRSSSRTVYDTTPGSTPSIISAHNDNGSGSTADATTATGYSPESLNHLTFNGTFTEVSHTVKTNNYGFSGMIANNSVENSFNRLAKEDDKGEETEHEEGGAGKRKRKSAGKQGRVPPRKRQS